MSTHTVRAILTIEVEADIEFNYIKGVPERGPAYSHGGLPADPPEVEFKSVDMPSTKVIQTLLDAAAEEWLAVEGYDKAVEEAADVDA